MAGGFPSGQTRVDRPQVLDGCGGRCATAARPLSWKAAERTHGVVSIGRRGPRLSLPRFEAIVAAVVVAQGADLSEIDTAALAAELYPFSEQDDVIGDLWAIVAERGAREGGPAARERPAGRRPDVDAPSEHADGPTTGRRRQDTPMPRPTTRPAQGESWRGNPDPTESPQ